MQIIIRDIVNCRNYLWEDGLSWWIELPFAITEVKGINNHGTIVGHTNGYCESSFEGNACVWSSGNLMEIGELPGDDHSQTRAINDSDVIVGYSYGPGDSRLHAVAWHNYQIVDLVDAIVNVDGWVLIEAMDINVHGQIVGYGEKSTYPRHVRGFLLTPIFALQDMSSFLDCMTGPGDDIAMECTPFNLKPDNGVDLADFAVFQRHMPE